VSEKSLKVPIMTPRLAARLERHKAKLPPFLPLFNRVFVYPVEEDDQPDTTAGGIVLAHTTKQRLGAQRGILCAAGMQAMDTLYSYGVNLGDYVITMRLSPWSRFYVDREGRPHSVLILFASDITASEDLLSAHEKGDVWFEMNETGETHLETREGPRTRKETDDPEDGV
jgi:co-chaperonin GroES (HSP10)